MCREFSFTGLEPVYDWLMCSEIGEEIAEFLCDLPEAVAFLLAVAFAYAACVLALVAVSAALRAFAILLRALLWCVMYVLRAIGLSKIAKKLGVKHRFLAWIPYANAYLFGACAEKSAKRDGKKPCKWSLILLLVTVGLGIGLPIVQLAVALVLILLQFPISLTVAITLLVEVASIALLVVTSVCLWRICRQFMDDPLAIIIAVLAPFCTELVAVLLFVIGCLKLRRSRAEEIYATFEEVPEQESAKECEDACEDAGAQAQAENA